ncbi:threalose-6-phosphate phosphatase [Podila horticola]|nr:threalose-6-phosphate phosphatase [Podila horticola]
MSLATHHPSSSTSSLASLGVIPLTELAETSQVTLSEKPRLINVTHQIPLACTIADRTSPSSPLNHANGLANSSGSPTNRRASLAVPRQCMSPSSASHSQPFPQDCTQGGQASNNGCILEQRRGHSALYSGITSVSKDLETIQIGWVGEIADQDGYVVPSKNLSESHKQSLKGKLWEQEKVVPIFLEDSRAAGHYEGYCKGVLWPLFHYILWDEATDGREEKRNWEDYVFVNQKFADAIVEQYQTGDIIWIHDYHLLLVPHMLRQKLPGAAIGFFFHAPFPSSEIFRCLPKRVEILNGLLGCCTRVNGYESTPRGVDAKGSTVWVGTFPIGIDAERVECQRKAPGVLPKIEAIRKLYTGKRIIVGRDKLDPVKGVQQKLQAFEKFLNNYPEMQGEVVLIQVTSPSLVENPKLEAKIAEMVANINGTFGSLNFTPVHHYHQHIDRDEYYALLSIADIGLITSVRDGMNTTSLEYIMCQQENHGPLILSEFTGTAGSLGGALMVNPWDYQGVARVIYDAMHLTKEDKAVRHRQLLDHVLAHTAQFWAKNFISELILNVGTWDQSAPTPYLDQAIIVEKFHSAKRRLLMFDYDGTLTPIRKTPSAAVPQEHMLNALTALANDPANIVWVISGRDQNVLEEWLGGVENLGFSAEHGSFMRQPGSKKWANLTESLDMGWKNDVIEIFTYYTERTQGSFIEHKRSSLTWHYRMADPEFGAFQAKECQNHLENAVLSKLPVEILVGKKNLEVRPTIINKGEIVKRLLSQHEDVEFVLCAGDDKTDEDMFRALASVGNQGHHNNRHESQNHSRHQVPGAIVEPYNNDLVAETAAKIAQAALEHSLEYAPIVPQRSDAPGVPASNSTSAAVRPHNFNHTHSGNLASTQASLASLSSQASLSPPVLNDYFSITIGHALKKTLANWHVTSPEELIRVLGILAGTTEA